MTLTDSSPSSGAMLVVWIISEPAFWLWLHMVLMLAWSRQSHKWLCIVIRDGFPCMIAFKYGKLPWNTTWGKRKTPGAELVSCFCFTSEKPKIIFQLYKIKYLKLVVLAWAELLEDLNQSKALSFWQKTQSFLLFEDFFTCLIQRWFNPSGKQSL